MKVSRDVNHKLILIYFLLIFFLLAGYYLGYFSTIENKVFDLWSVIEYNSFLGEIRDPVIVGIDSKTLNYFSDWPLSRTVYAEVIDILMENEAAGVGVDITFSSPGEDEGDVALVDTLGRYDNVVLPVTADIALEQRPGGRKIVTAENFSLPIEDLAASAQLGHINLIYDRDGVVRTRPPSFSTYPSFSRAMAELIEPDIDRDKNSSNWYQHKINFYGPEGTIPRISLLDVLKGRFEEDYFAGKLVFIGATASEILDDTYITPLARYGQMSGVEVHAANTLNYLENNFKYCPFEFNLGLLGLVMFSGVAVFYLLSLRRAVIGLVSFGVLYIAVSLYIFVRQDIYLSTATVLISLLFMAVIGIIHWYLVGERERKRLVKSFSGYVSEEVLSDILTSPDKVRPGGELREVTVFFLDIRGFTAYSDKRPPEEVVEVLNELFSHLSGIIMESGGTVDKYLGDGIMAYFGAPINVIDHRQKAVQTARKVHKFLFESEYEFEVGIGINSGEVVAGNIGSRKRMDYTVMGTAVNRAARFVDLAGPGEIVIGKSVYLALPESKRGGWRQFKEQIRGSERELVLYKYTYGGISSAQ
ncbi:MAG: CHASE2 domain-containing protein [Halanaerobiaceae bacterium]